MPPEPTEPPCDEAEPSGGEAAGGPSARDAAYGARMARNRAHPHTTIKACLKSRVAPEAWEATIAAIDEAVLHVSKIARRGSQVVSLVALDLLRRGPLPDTFAAGNTFFRQCFLAGLERNGTPGTVSDPDVQRIATLHAGALSGQRVSRIRGDGQLLSYAAQDYTVNFRNHILVNHEARLKAYVRAVLTKHYGPARSKKWPKALLFRAVKYVTHVWDATADLRFGDAAYDPLVVADLQRLREKHSELLGAGRRLNARETANRTLELQYWILRRLEVLGGRQFAIAPLAAVRRQHMTIDRVVFREFLFPRLQLAGFFSEGTSSADLKNDAEICDAHMAQVFRGGRKLRSARAGWVPTAVLQTDGYSLCTNMINTQRTVTAAQGTGRERRSQAREAKLEGCLPADWSERPPDIGVDMGLVNIYYAAWEKADGGLGTKSLTRAEYYKAGGIKQHTGIVKRRMLRLAPVVTAMAETARRTWRSDAFLAYVVVCSENHAALWEELGDKRLARSRMATFMSKTRALDGFVRSMVAESGIVDPVVACGFPDYNCNAGGCPSAPTTTAFKRLRLYTRLLPTDEYNTSRYCHQCNARLVAPRRKNENGKMVEVRGIRLCNSTTCWMLHGDRDYERDPGKWKKHVRYARDKVGAANILRCGGRAPQQRPQCLRRPLAVFR